jgi:cell division protein FtsX
MIRHAVAEGWLLLRHRWGVSLGLALSLAVPISFAGVTWSVMRWLEPVVGIADRATVVPVLLHPHMDPDQRRQWIAEQRAAHPEWRMEEVGADRLAQRLTRWFPYLDDLLEDGGGAMLSPLVEVTTEDPEGLEGLEGSPAVIAVGPLSSVRRAVGWTARVLGWVLGLTSAALLVAAALFAAVWVHLELYRHADEITIMRLIGATESAIRSPFLMATLVPGVGAAVLATTGSLMIVARLSRMTEALGLPSLAVSPAALVVEVVVGCALPLAAALFTLARHAATDFAD